MRTPISLYNFEKKEEKNDKIKKKIISDGKQTENLDLYITKKIFFDKVSCILDSDILEKNI